MIRPTAGSVLGVAIAIGVAIGLVIDSLAIGTAVGVALGLAFLFWRRGHTAYLIEGRLNPNSVFP